MFKIARAHVTNQWCIFSGVQCLSNLWGMCMKFAQCIIIWIDWRATLKVKKKVAVSFDSNKHIGCPKSNDTQSNGRFLTSRYEAPAQLSYLERAFVEKKYMQFLFKTLKILEVA
ncbi:uncharacterized protein [Euwallacea fornicatus]|uniref:uncharacterized protein n=1 Tax=Euwallacea fornicatus TaxID=995702 RepID=UPI00338F7005